jgi:hypothetical protein
MALTQHLECEFDDKPSSHMCTGDGALSEVEGGEYVSSSWSMELSRWRVRLRRLKRWSRYEGRASDGQFDTNDVPEGERLRSASEYAAATRLRHSLTSLGSVTIPAPTPDALRKQLRYEPVVPPVRIPSVYRQQDRQRGVRVGGDRVTFTLDGHRRRRKTVRPLPRVDEDVALELDVVPDMRHSMATVYARMGRPTRSRRTRSV